MVRLISYHGAGQPMLARGILRDDSGSAGTAGAYRPLAPLVLAILQASTQPLTRLQLLAALTAAGRPVKPAGLNICLVRMRANRQVVTRPGPNGADFPKHYAAGIVNG